MPRRFVHNAHYPRRNNFLIKRLSTPAIWLVLKECYLMISIAFTSRSIGRSLDLSAAIESWVCPNRVVSPAEQCSPFLRRLNSPNLVNMTLNHLLNRRQLHIQVSLNPLT